MARVRVKICGITTVADARAAVAAGADALGLVFAESPRRIDGDRAAEIIAAVSPFVVVVGVFMDQPIDLIADTALQCDLDFVQLHGGETPEFCDEVQSRTNIPIIKTFKARVSR